MENFNYKNKNIQTKYLNNMRKNHFLKVKNSLLELKKDFIELNYRIERQRSKNQMGDKRAIF